MLKTSYYSLLFGALLAHSATAEVIVDNSLGTATTITPTAGNYAITEANGLLSGNGENLLHSFDKFNIGASETATFSGPTSVKNILSRVTGGKSTINGGIVSEIPGANLWLINPQGILFGEKASLDVQGSFHASTADYIKFQDGLQYNAVVESPILSVSAPKAFGFIDPANSTASLDVVNVKLTVPEGESITFLGSDVNLRGSFLSAPGGNISVVSINETGEVIYSDRSSEALDVSSIDSFGHISIDSTAFTINGEQNGKLQIKGGELEINSRDTDFVSSVTSLNTNFFEDKALLEKPCELADFYNQGKMNFTINLDEDETEYGVKTKKTNRGPIGLKADECL